jgi:hypothetical protein
VEPFNRAAPSRSPPTAGRPSLAGRARAGKAPLRSAPKLLLFLKPIAAAEHVVTFFNAVCARVRHDKPTGSVSNLLATAALIIALLGLLMVLMCVRGNGGVRQAAVNRVHFPLPVQCGRWIEKAIAVIKLKGNPSCERWVYAVLLRHISGHLLAHGELRKN